jgi:putative transposase
VFAVKRFGTTPSTAGQFRQHSGDVDTLTDFRAICNYMIKFSIPAAEQLQRLAGGVSHRSPYTRDSRPGRGARTPYAMPSTHLSLHYHIVFSTKDRAAVIEPSWEGRLHAYLGGVVRNIDGVAETVGGVSDHVHLLIGLRATACLADVVRDVKGISSRWVHEEIGERAFAWQEGYGAFTVSASQRGQVREYIAQQEEHHRKRTFQEEYLDLLERSGVEYDTRYLW